MKVIALETENFAAAVPPGGLVQWAPCAGALELKLAADGLEPGEWRPEGKAGLKAAVLAALGSADPAAAMRSFCGAYLAAGKPEGACACWAEICFAGGGLPYCLSCLRLPVTVQYTFRLCWVMTQPANVIAD